MMRRQNHTFRKASRGFTLLEVVVSLAILALSLGALLESQITSLNNADRTRALSVATLLARSKVIDAEHYLFDEGFPVGESTEEGDFEEEGHGEIKWKWKIAEIKLDLSSLSSLCGVLGGAASGGASGGKGDKDQKDSKGGTGSAPGTSCESMIASMGGPLGGVTQNVSQSIRAVEVTVTWPLGRYSESMTIRGFVTR